MGRFFIIVYTILLVFLFLTAAWKPIEKVSNIRVETVEVTDKMVKDDVYLIYSKENTYEITDSLLRLRFNSSDLYGKIEVGKTYQMTIGGKRRPFLSWYPNIYEAVEVEGDH